MHTVMDGRVRLYRRPEGRVWQAATHFLDRDWRKSTGTRDIFEAQDIAAEWYIDLRAAAKAGTLEGITFEAALKGFLQEYEAMVGHERHPRHIINMTRSAKKHILPILGSKSIKAVNTTRIQAYRIARLSDSPALSTLNKEISIIRQALSYAVRQGWIDTVPETKSPYRQKAKVMRRAWFAPRELEKLLSALKARTLVPGSKHHVRNRCETYDFVEFLLYSGMRPDEAWNTLHTDITTDAKGRIIIDVRGKRGVGYCLPEPEISQVLERIDKRREDNKGLVFPVRHECLFKRVLVENNLRFDRDGQPRTYYSLRHTYICEALKAGKPSIWIAKNCRTSVSMIERHYGAHIGPGEF